MRYCVGDLLASRECHLCESDHHVLDMLKNQAAHAYGDCTKKSRYRNTAEDGGDIGVVVLLLLYWVYGSGREEMESGRDYPCVVFLC